ncbi:MAG: DUF1345 domain-containing protein [Croceibacterium sp.]
MTQHRRESAIDIGKRIAPLRFVVFVILLVLGYFVYRGAVPGSSWADALATSFDVAAVVFLASLAPLLAGHTAGMMRAHSQANDANRVLVLLFTTLLTLVVMAAITGEMPEARKGSWLALTKLFATLILIWTFANAIYALHYAHAFYSRQSNNGGDTGGLEFPGTPLPSYVDFAYFSFNVAMAFSTSDVNVTLSVFRRVVMLQSLAAFLFNIGVIAFTINVLAGSSG